MQTVIDQAVLWPLWRKILFRFFCIYIPLYIQPWTWIGYLPVVGQINEYFGNAESWLVNLANTHLFHVKDVLVPLNGSGDTSYGYAQLCLFVLLALVGIVIWTALDRRRNYELGYYWLLVLTRYYVAMTSLSYGLIKLYGQQMIFPSLSALATPLGDFLPMRFSWFFIGYSAPYQFFSGLMEVVAGLLLLFRRTSTLGALTAVGVFLNVMMLNLCYDIPVKLFSIHLFLFSSFLLVGDAKRLLNFFVFNKPTAPAPRVILPTRWMRNAQVALKVLFIILFGVLPAYQIYDSLDKPGSTPKVKPLATGVFEVEKFDAPVADSLRWKDVIFEAGTTGSIQTADTLFRQRYHRGYFGYKLDTVKRTIAFKRFTDDSLPKFTMHYAMPDTNHLLLTGKIRNDSVHIALKRLPRHFQLAERQFHWLSEANR